MPQDVRPSAYVSLYLSKRRTEGCNENTLKGYRYALDMFLATDGMPEGIGDLNFTHALAWLDAMRARGVSDGAINSYQRPVWGWLRWLFRKRCIGEDIAGEVKMVRVKDRKRRTATLDVRKVLVEVALDRAENANRNAAIVETFWSSGVRLSELAGVELDGVDLEAGTMQVMGKGGKPRIVGIGVEARLAIETYLVEDRGRAPGPLFMARGKVGMTPNAIKCVLRSLAKSAEVKAAAHDFRRACAARLLADGAPVDDVMRQLGHDTMTMSLIYGEAGRDKRALETFHQLDKGITRLDGRRRRSS